MTVSERLAGTVLSLPLYPEMPGADADRVIGEVRAYFNAPGWTPPSTTCG